jgi:hypothetical protein
MSETKLEAHVVEIEAETTAVDNMSYTYAVSGTRWRWLCSCKDCGLFSASARSARAGGQRHVAAMERAK